jgi:hypothetical protein
MAKAQINRQDQLASSSAEREAAPVPAPAPLDIAPSPEQRDAAIHAPSHPVVVANPEHRAKTESIPATRVGELPGPSGTAAIHTSTQTLPVRDGDLDPIGWYSGQGGITGDHTRDTVPLSDEAKEDRREMNARKEREEKSK